MLMSKQPQKIITAVANAFMPSAFGLAIYFIIFSITALVNQPSSYKDTWHTVIMNDWRQSFIYHYGSSFTNLLRTQTANTIALYIFWGVIGLVVAVTVALLTDLLPAASKATM